ncbi:hypothetical protein CK203_055605 [Vitis vinifera]|uniref:Uncharacterized protein n=1 Tax=Vitis vinifera TaxID=29760 RepID=A0A438FVA0_VITVI|nr:hypothetical protein CK203_055605 [Vitis vinifera]
MRGWVLSSNTFFRYVALRARSERTKWAMVISEFAPICIYLVISPLVSLIPDSFPIGVSTDSCPHNGLRNPMIGGLQGDFGNLDIKYLKQNISKCQTYPEQLHLRVWLSGATPSGWPKRTRGALPYPDSLREKHPALANITHPNDSISSYPDMLSGSLSHTPCIPNLLMEKDFKASVLHVSELSIALPWIPNNSPQSWIALVIKKLSKHQNLTQFD